MIQGEAKTAVTPNHFDHPPMSDAWPKWHLRKDSAAQKKPVDMGGYCLLLAPVASPSFTAHAFRFAVEEEEDEEDGADIELRKVKSPSR